MPKPLEFYLAGEYAKEIIEEGAPEGTIYVARIISMPGCLAQSDDRTDAEEKLDQLLVPYIQSRLERGADIPEPDLPAGSMWTSVIIHAGGTAQALKPPADVGMTIDSDNDQLMVAMG